MVKKTPFEKIRHKFDKENYRIVRKIELQNIPEQEEYTPKRERERTVNDMPDISLQLKLSESSLNE